MSSPARRIRTTASRTACAAVAVVVVVLAAAACTASDDNVDAGAPAAPSGSAPVSLAGNVADHGEQQVSGATPELAMELDDNYFAPTYVRAEPGAVVKVELENEGTRVHTFTIDDRSVDVTVQPGSTAQVDVTVPASGSLHYFCQIHSGTGMQGSFFVDGASTPPTTAPTSTPTTGSSGGYGGY